MPVERQGEVTQSGDYINAEGRFIERADFGVHSRNEQSKVEKIVKQAHERHEALEDQIATLRADQAMQQDHAEARHDLLDRQLIDYMRDLSDRYPADSQQLVSGFVVGVSADYSAETQEGFEVVSDRPNETFMVEREVDQLPVTVASVDNILRPQPYSERVNNWEAVMRASSHGSVIMEDTSWAEAIGEMRQNFAGPELNDRFLSEQAIGRIATPLVPVAYVRVEDNSALDELSLRPEGVVYGSFSDKKADLVVFLGNTMLEDPSEVEGL